MKNIKNSIPYFLALLPQFLITNYTIIVFSVVGIGYMYGIFSKDEDTFKKMFLYQLIVFSFIFYLNNNNVDYFKIAIHNLGAPPLVASIIFIIFNALNIAILFFLGNKLQRLTFKTITS